MTDTRFFGEWLTSLFDVLGIDSEVALRFHERLTAENVALRNRLAQNPDRIEKTWRARLAPNGIDCCVGRPKPCIGSLDQLAGDRPVTVARTPTSSKEVDRG